MKNLWPWLKLLMRKISGFFLPIFLSILALSAHETVIAGSLIGESETDSAVWGKLFPQQYDSYLKTKNTDFASQENGSIAIDMLERDPRLVILWAGTGFSQQYDQGRGHYYAVEDTRKTLRAVASQPMACWACKSPQSLVKMKGLGAREFYKGKFEDGIKEIIQPIGCLDCHDPDTLSLRSARPALEEALSRQGKDLNKAIAQEKRALVCAQCHAEYYFKGPENYLTFPWDNGMKVEDIEKYYDDAGFADWVHGLSRAPMLKAQHPDYELYRQGTLAQIGLTCVDCHMPLSRENNAKFTDHHVQSPLNNIPNACLRCHPEGEEAVRKHVYELQHAVKELRIKAEDILVQAHIEAKYAWDAGASDDEMKDILRLIRKAQWRWDFVASSHGAAFHATKEVTRILNSSIEFGEQARAALKAVLIKHKVKLPVDMPDISTKEKAQKYIGLDTLKLIKEN